MRKLMKADINNCASYVNKDRGSSYEHVQVDGWMVLTFSTSDSQVLWS